MWSDVDTMRLLSRSLALLSAVALIAGVALRHADRTTFRSEPFAARVDLALREPAVRTALARRLSNAAIGAVPDLVTVRPLIQLGAERVVGTGAFASLVRNVALDSHRSAFDEHRPTVRARIRDAGILLARAVRRFRPDLAARVPANLTVPIARISDGLDAATLKIAERADRARRWTPIAFGAALLLALGAILAGSSVRASLLRLGGALGLVAGATAGALALAPGVIASRLDRLDGDAVQAALEIWLRPLAADCAALAGIGVVVAAAAYAVVAPIRLGPPVARLVRAGRSWRPGAAGRVARAAVAAALGLVMVLAPGTTLAALVVIAGAAVLAWAATELLSLAARGSAKPTAAASSPDRRAVLRVAAAAAAIAVVLVVAADRLGDEPARSAASAVAVVRCDGSPGLCDRRFDDVVLLGTHNAMAADGERSWIFPAQDAGIAAQLRDGVRALLIDTHYGFPTRLGVVTDLSGPTNSRAKLVEQFGTRYVATAERLRRRYRRLPRGPRGIYLCHGFCEVGATGAVAALSIVHRFLVAHPHEVVLISMEDDISPADTAAIIRASGLVDEVYRGPARAPWPTLRTMVGDNQRAVLLAENGAPAQPWIHRQAAVMQETPYRFPTAAALDDPNYSCRPNRGGTAGSLLLMNHWVDTSPAPRVTIADRVNARAFLDRRIAACRHARGRLPSVLAVDFYRRGDAKAVVTALNEQSAP